MGRESIARRTASPGIGALAVAAIFALAGCDSPSGGSPDTPPPAEVSQLHANSEKGQVTLTWNAPGASDFDHVEISWKPEHGGSQPKTVTSGAASTTVTSLTNADSDGDLDIVMSGNESVTGTQLSTKLYENRFFQ
jgi:hypothetical protein